MSKQNIFVRSVVALKILATSVVLGIGPVYSADAISDQQTCNAALSNAENTIVNANIDSKTFRVLNDHLVKIRGLCGKQDFASAEAEMRAFNELRK